MDPTDLESGFLHEEDIDENAPMDVIRHQAHTGDRILYNNALRENIETKGKNSYYYAHGTERSAPAWDGKEEPRLLNVESVTPPKPKPLEVPAYLWADGKRTVKVYIETEFLGAPISEENIQLSHQPNSFSVLITANDKQYQLMVPDLSHEIEGVSFVVKPDKIVVSLQKTDETSWYKLRA